MWQSVPRGTHPEAVCTEADPYAPQYAKLSVRRRGTRIATALTRLAMTNVEMMRIRWGAARVVRQEKKLQKGIVFLKSILTK